MNRNTHQEASQRIRRSFFELGCEMGMALAADSDLLDLQVDDDGRCQRFLATFHCRGLVRHNGKESIAEQFVVGFNFPDHYQTMLDTRGVISILHPSRTWHPNIIAPGICVGNMSGGVPLPDLLFQIFSMLTYQNWASGNGLNQHACAWARQNAHCFPIDRRPLKWKQGDPDPTRPIELEEVTK